ncbi:hypothetical protein SB783_43875, partial [Paraburkholderia sp. SIMBA_009]
EGRIVSILEGGYSLEALATGTMAHVRALMNAGHKKLRLKMLYRERLRVCTEPTISVEMP